MAIIQLQLRQGPETQRLQLTPLQGEMIYTTDNKMVFVGDGVTPGGNALRVPMPSQGTADTSDLAASTRFVQQAIANVTGVNLSDYARKSVDNNFTGTNNNFTLAPTISAVIPLGENSSKVPTTQWVKSILGTSGNAALRDSANTFTSLNDFTVSPTAPTAAVNDSSSKLATTQFVKNVLNSNGLGLSTITLTAGVGTSINHSAGTVTLPNGNVVNVLIGTISLPSSGTYYITVDSNGIVGHTNVYPTGGAIRVIGTVTVLAGAITGLDLSGTDLSSYAKLSGAIFTGPVRSPTPLSSVNDTTVATTAWVNSRLGGGGTSNDVVLESTSNAYQTGTTQDFTLANILVAPLAPSDSSNKAASTSFVQGVVTSALAGGGDLTQYARKDGATFTGIARGPIPAQLSSDNQLATTSWVRDVLDDVIIGGDIFPTLTARVGTRIIDHGTGRIRVNTSINCTIAAGDIEIPANQTVWLYVDPTCGINHYPFTSVAIKPPTGKAFAYATTNANSITSIILLQPDTIIKGNVVVEYDLTVNGALNVPGGVTVTTPPLNDNDTSVATTAWVRAFAESLQPLGTIRMNWSAAGVVTDGFGFVWALCNGQAAQAGWWWTGNPVPDFRDRFLQGENGVAGPGGSNSIVLSNANMPIHAHPVSPNPHEHQVVSYELMVNGDVSGDRESVLYAVNTSNRHEGTNEFWRYDNTWSVGNGTAYNNGQPISKRNSNAIEATALGTSNTGSGVPFDNRPSCHTTNYYIRVK
jgi:hypothetical protein